MCKLCDFVVGKGERKIQGMPRGENIASKGRSSGITSENGNAGGSSDSGGRGEKGTVERERMQNICLLPKNNHTLGFRKIGDLRGKRAEWRIVTDRMRRAC